MNYILNAKHGKKIAVILNGQHYSTPSYGFLRANSIIGQQNLVIVCDRRKICVDVTDCAQLST